MSVAINIPIPPPIPLFRQWEDVLSFSLGIQHNYWKYITFIPANSMQRATSKVNSNPLLPCVILPKIRIHPKLEQLVWWALFLIKNSRFNWLLPLLNVLHFVGILNDLRTHPTGKQWFSLHYKMLNSGILSDFNLYLNHLCPQSSWFHSFTQWRTKTFLYASSM